MKILNDKEICGLPAYTKSGEYLGKVEGFEVDVDSQNIVTYKVKYRGAIRGLFKDYLLIGREQVVAFESDRIIVEDGLSRAEKNKKAREVAAGGVISEGAGIAQSKITR